MARLQDRADSIARAVRFLEKPRAHLWLTGAALLLLSPALANGLLLDDHVLALLARRDPGVAGFHSSPLSLFRFTSGRVEDNRALMDQGALLPWWSDPHHLNAFFRPLSSLTHLLDFSLWPNSPWLMHLHSLAWLAVLLLVVAHVYHRLATHPSAVTTLAFALFALDGSHGMTVAWIANRNALIALTLALPALSAHHAWRAHRFAPGAYLGPLCFGLGLCAGETALAVLGYLLAYALVLDRAPVGRRLLHLAPYLALLLLWRAAYVRLGLGSAGSGGYHDPGREPLAYALALANHLPVLLSARLGIPLVETWFWGPPELHLPIWLVSMATLGALALFGHLLLSKDPEARFWTLGMVISGAVVAAAVPGERLLLVPGVGAAMFLAKLIWKLLPERGIGRMVLPQRAFARPLLALLVLLHLVLSPLRLPLWAWSMGRFGAAIERVDRSIPSTTGIASRTVVVVNAPFDLMLSYVQLARATRHAPRPAHLHWLASASSELEVQTLDASALLVRPARGFMLTPAERHYRGNPRALGMGAKVALSEMTVRVSALTADARPAAAEFRFREPLSSPRYLLLRWERGRLLPFLPPPPGKSVHMPRTDFFATLVSERLRLPRWP